MVQERYELNKYRISTEQSTKLVQQLYKGKAEKRITDSGKSNLQSLTINRQLKDFRFFISGKSIRGSVQLNQHQRSKHCKCLDESIN